MKTILLSILLLSIGYHSLAQGKIERAKADLNSSSQSLNRTGSGDGDGSEGASNFVGAIGLDMLFLATYGTLVGNLQPRYFLEYPYADGESGEYEHPEFVSVLKKSTLIISNTLTVQSGTFGNDLRLNYRFLPALGLQANHLHLFDRLDENSNLGISSLMLNFYRIRERRVTGYWGLGAAYVGSEVNTSGFSYNFGLDIFMANPVSLEIFWKQSFINESSVNEFRTMLRYHIGKLAIHGGFINYAIGNEGFPSAAIGASYRF
jgi:hypothetical protein